jgi:hypothetical protein
MIKEIGRSNDAVFQPFGSSHLEFWMICVKSCYCRRLIGQHAALADADMAQRLIVQNSSRDVFLDSS